jgi:recombination protein RecT
MNENTQLATRKYEPLAPIGSAAGLKALLEAQAGSIAIALPKHVTPERLIKTLLVATNRTPDLLKCTQASIMETINRAAELGLDLSGTLGEAYPVPFNTKASDGNYRMQCQLIIGYRGMEKLAWQTGEIASIDAEVVYEADKFIFRKGTEVRVEWEPSLSGGRGRAVGAYCCVSLKNGGRLARFMPTDDIERIRQNSRSKDSPAWRDHWDEMARKCAIKRTLKDAPLSAEKFSRAMDIDAEDVDGVDVLSATSVSGNEAKALTEKAKRLPAPQSHPLTPEPAYVDDYQEHQPMPQQAEKPAPPPPAVPVAAPPPPPPVVAAASDPRLAAPVSTWDEFLNDCVNWARACADGREYAPENMAETVKATILRLSQGKRWLDAGGDTTLNRNKLLDAIEEARGSFSFLQKPEKKESSSAEIAETAETTPGEPVKQEGEQAAPLAVSDFASFRKYVGELGIKAGIAEDVWMKSIKRVGLILNCSGKNEPAVAAQDSKGATIRAKLDSALARMVSGSWDWANPPMNV